MWSPKTNYPICLIGLILTLVFLPRIAIAQTVTGTLRGTVSDSKGAVVPGADVVIRNMETGQERTLKTGSEGVYAAPFMPLGRYTITATGPGFSKVTQENIELGLNQTLVVNFELSPSAVTEAVVVTSDAAPINTTNAEIKGSLNAQDIAAMKQGR